MVLTSTSPKNLRGDGWGGEGARRREEEGEEGEVEERKEGRREKGRNKGNEMNGKDTYVHGKRKERRH